MFIACRHQCNGRTSSQGYSFSGSRANHPFVILWAWRELTNTNSVPDSSKLTRSTDFTDFTTFGVCITLVIIMWRNCLCFQWRVCCQTWDYSVCSVHLAVRVKDSAVLVVSMLLASMLKNWLIASSSHALSAKASCFWHIIDMKQAIFRGIPSEVQQTTVSPQFSGARR